MTTTPDELLLATRFELLVSRLEAAGLLAPDDPVLLAAPTLPPNVAAGELITAAWGNAVADLLEWQRYHTPWVGASTSLAAGWGSGLRSIGTCAVPAVPADTVDQVTLLCVASYTMTGAAGSGAPLAGATIRSRFRLSPGVDTAITHSRVATSDQQVMVETFQAQRSAGSPATSLEVWNESDKSANISGSAVVWQIVGGAY